MKNKKSLISILLVLGLIILLAIIILAWKQLSANKTNKELNNMSTSTFQADFLKPEEKQALNIPADLKVQALKRDADGSVMVYKIIRNDSEAVDPAKIAPISPRAR